MRTAHYTTTVQYSAQEVEMAVAAVVGRGSKTIQWSNLGPIFFHFISKVSSLRLVRATSTT